MSVWIFSLVCVAVNLDECKLMDPVLFPRTLYDSREECISAGRLMFVNMKLPKDKWAVFCMDGVMQK